MNALLRAYAREHLSPTPGDRTFVASVYKSVCDVIGADNALQIGSYPRFTAIRPLHDLDVLFILGVWDPLRHDPAAALAQLERQLKSEYENPTPYRVAIALQTHSVTIKYLDGETEVFAVDVVPAYKQGTNSYGQDMYVVPEIATASHRDRRAIREAVARGDRAMTWIASDPRGYIAAAAELNDANSDFRKAVKIAKAWRASCKDNDDSFPLKSFHLEQAITQWVRDNVHADIFGMLFMFFYRLRDFVRYPQIPDRAEPSREIDAYVAQLPEAERKKVLEARDGFLIKLENFAEGGSIATLLRVDGQRRSSADEAYLFDQGIPMLNEQDFSIVAEVQPREGGFRAYILDKLGLIGVDRKIRFRVASDAPAADIYKWKVKNDDNSPDPRGEITDHRTKNDPEHTKYKGHHFVECYAIRAGTCIGRSHQNVILDGQWGG